MMLNNVKKLKFCKRILYILLVLCIFRIVVFLLDPWRVRPIERSKKTLPGVCPSWLKDYEAFHEENKRNGREKYLIFSFNEAFDSRPGLGDRIRSALWALRLAAATERVFVLSMNQPFDLETVWMPNRIDWRNDGIYTMFKSRFWYGFYYWFKFYFSSYVVVNMEYKNINDFRDKNVIIECNYNSKLFPYASDELPIDDVNKAMFDVDPSMSSSDLHCLFTFLFKNTKYLQDLIDIEKRKIDIYNKKYASIHIRGTNMIGESEILANRGDTLHNFVSSIHYIEKLNLTTLLIASDSVIRHAISLGLFSQLNIVNPTLKNAIHIKYKSNNKNDHVTTFVELGLLGDSVCKVVTQGGYSDISRWISGPNNCTIIAYSDINRKNLKHILGVIDKETTEEMLKS